MNCPHCGMKVKDSDTNRYCPSCGGELPVRTPDVRHGITYRRLSGILLLPGIMLLFLGFTLLLPEVIIYYIGGIGLLYWPVQVYLLVAGAALLIIRIPFARRSRGVAAQLVREAEMRWICSYCGKENVPGSRECESCGAPLK